jgi:hypothetical protein
MPPATRTPQNQKIQSPSRRGGARPGAGRKRGTPDKATPEQKEGLEERARTHTDIALLTLVEIATTGTSEPARVTAANSLLDRGYGKPRQAVEHSGEGGGPLLVTVTHRVIDPIAHATPHTNGNGTKPRLAAR